MTAKKTFAESVSDRFLTLFLCKKRFQFKISRTFTVETNFKIVSQVCYQVASVYKAKEIPDSHQSIILKKKRKPSEIGKPRQW